MKYLFLSLLSLAACAPTTNYTAIQAHPTTIVKFCSETTAYPGTFAEIGFCIDNQVYAVYSANDGFLTLISPGRYSSRAINSSCSFTVLDNCVILR